MTRNISFFIAKIKVTKTLNFISISILQNNIKLNCLASHKKLWEIGTLLMLMSFNFNQFQDKVYLTLNSLSFWGKYLFLTSHSKKFWVVNRKSMDNKTMDLKIQQEKDSYRISKERNSESILSILRKS